jgi:hypothetical protein
MRLAQFMLLALVALLASCATATKSANARNLLSFEDVESDSKPTEEERVSSGAISAAEGGRTGAGTTVVSSDPEGGGTVTVSIYNNNGLMQKIKRWWLKRLGKEVEKEERASQGAISAAEGGRTGASVSVVSANNGNSETVTVSVYENNGLFQRIVRWWKKLWTTEVPKATTKSTTESTRLRQ